MSDKRLTADIGAEWRLEEVPDLRLGAGLSLDGLLGGAGEQEVLAIRSADGDRPLTELRKLHKDRLGGRNIPLVVAAIGARVTLLGPAGDSEPLGPLTRDHAERILAAFLSEPSPVAARQRIRNLAQSVRTAEGMLGIDNSGLFATHYLGESVRRRADWADAVERGRPLLTRRGPDLIRALGYESEGLGAGALLLKAGDGPPHAVAVLIDQSEGFDNPTARFDASPVAYGLKWATQQRVSWVVIARGSELRLYPARPDIGVGRRSQSETYFSIDLAVVDDSTAGFLALMFAAGALDELGSVAEILDGSERYAASLGERLRDRVYTKVVPRLAVAVADELEELGYRKDLDSAYRITLKILFRLLFQAYGEDQGLLPYKRNDRYTRNSLTTQAQDFVRDPDGGFDPESHSIWDDLQQVWSVIDTGDRAWDVPAYNGGLFGSDPELHPDGYRIARMKLSNDAVGTALRNLLVDETEDGLGAVDFRSLSVREFGTIYEGLLESSLSRAEQDLTLDKNGAYIPAGDGDDVVAGTGEVYFHNASGERKATGSYFTPSFAVEHLLERTLDPALDRHLEEVRGLLEAGNESEAYERFFDFRVADLAMGSGHFLVAAVDRIEAKMSAFLVDHPIPRVRDELNRLQAAAREALGDTADDHTIEPASLLRRQIARRCIYGLDINEIAVELARVGIWIHTFVPGLPMSSLDHNLVCANSLTGIGTIEEAINALDPRRRPGQPSLMAGEIEASLAAAQQLLIDRANSLEASKAEVNIAAETNRRALEAASAAKAILDAAVATRVGLLGDVTLRPVDELADLTQQTHITEALREIRPGHMPYLFPEVMMRERPGFDVLIGNPPWEQLQVKSLNWWVLRIPGLKGLSNQAREKKLKEVQQSRPDLAAALERETARVDRIRQVIETGPFPGLRSGHIDLYQVFAWRNWQLIRDAGAFGLVLPRSAVAAAGTTEWRRTILEAGTFEDVCVLTNGGGWVFPDIDPRYTVALVAASRASDRPVRFSGPFHSMAEYRELAQRPNVVARSEFASWSDSLTFPRIPDEQACDILRSMKEHPRFDDTAGWDLQPVQGDMNATSDRDLFDTDLSRTDLDLPVLTGKSFEIWSPDFGDPYGRADSSSLLPHLLKKAKASTRRSNSAFGGMEIVEVADLPISRVRIAFRDVTNSTNSRTAIFCLLPPNVAIVNAAPYLLRRSGAERDEAYLLGILCSIPFDWYARRWVELHLNFHLLNPMPVPRPAPDDPARVKITELAGRLAATDDRYQQWAEAVGVPVGTLKSKPELEDAIAELDALAALAYGLEWDDVEHIFTTFHRGWKYKPRLERVRQHYETWSRRA